jgi:hypothetical protein
MAATANRERYRRMRSLILSASILSFLPLFGLMQSGVSKTESVAQPPAAVVQAASETSATPDNSGAASLAEAQSTPITTQASNASTPSTQTTASTQSSSSSQTTYTRTKAS